MELGGAANVNIGSTTGNTLIRSANTVLTGDLFVNGGDIVSTSTTFTLANNTATTLSVGGGATALLLGATTGTATIRNATTVIAGDLTVSGGDIVGTASLNLANTTTTALEIGGGATTLNMGSATANTTIRGPNLNVGATISTGFGVSTGTSAIELGTHRTGDGSSFIDFHSTSGSDFEARILRSSGANGNFEIYNTGTGNTIIYTGNAERARFNANGQFGTGGIIPKSQFHLYNGSAGQLTANLTDAGSRTDMLRLSAAGSSANTGGVLVFASQQSDTSNSVGFAAIKGMLDNGAGNTTGSISFSTRNANTDVELTERVRIERGGNLTVINDLAVNGGDITTTSSTFTVANTTATTVWLGGGATSNVIVGATSGNTTLRSADTTVDGKLTVKGITNIGVNTSTDAVRITQQGSGNALVIQDESSDSSPIVVDAQGRLIVGGTEWQSTWFAASATPATFITGNTTNGDGLGIMTYGSTPMILMGRHGPNTLNTRGTVSNGDNLGQINFAGDDNIGSGLSKGATIQAFVDSVVDTANTNTIPTTILIRTKTANVSTPATTATFDSSGNTTLSTNLAVLGSNITTTNATFAIANTGATTLSVGGAATSLLIGATTGTTTIRNASTVVTGDLTVSGGDIIGTASLNLANVTSTTLNIGGAATTLNIGATTGNTTIRNAGTVIAGDLFVQGGDIVATTATANLANSTTTTLNIGGAANVITVGANTGTLTINNNKVVVNSTGALRVPVGNTIQRGTASQGEVRYNTELTAYEGYDGTNWSSLGGVKSVDGLTYIIAESSPGNSDDTLHFYTANGATSYEVAQMNATKLAILQTTSSTSATTGALTVAGGVGINERLNVNGPTSISASLTVTGNTVIGGGGLTTTNTIFTVANTTATLVEVGGAANVNIGSTTGNTTIRSANTIITGNTIIGGNLTVNGNTTIINSTTLSIDDKNIVLADNATDNTSANGAGITIAGSNANVVYLSASDSFSLNKNVIAELDLAVNGGDITTTSSTFNVANATATTVSVGGAATALLLGATTGTTTIRNANTIVTGNLGVGNTAPIAKFQINTQDGFRFDASGSNTTMRFGSALTGEATGELRFERGTGSIVISRGNSGNTLTEFARFNNSGDFGIGTIPTGGTYKLEVAGSLGVSGKTVLTGDLAVNGANVTTTNTTFSIANTTATTMSVGGAANSLLIGATTGTATIRNATTVVTGDLNVNGGDINTTATTFTLANTTATTMSVGGAATALLLGATTGTATIRNASTVVTGDLNVNGGDIGTTATTFTVANTTATTLWLGAGATSNVLIGNASGTTFIRSANTIVNGNFTANGTITETANGQQWAVASQYDIGMNPNQIPLNQYLGSMAFQSADAISVGAATVSADLSVNSGNVITTSTTFNVANTTATSVSVGGAANVLIGSTTGNTNIRSANTVLSGELFVNGGDIYTTATTFSVANNTATTLSVGGAATSLLLGANTGTTTIRNASTVLAGDLAVNGGDITTSATTFNVANTTATTLSVGGAATSLLLGALNTGTATIRNAATVLSGTLDSFGAASLCTGGSGDALIVGLSGGRVIINAGAANNNIKAENANGTMSIYAGGTTSNGITVAANGSVSINSTIVSTSNTTGALRVAGGLGVVGNTYISGDIVLNGANVITTNTAFNIANTTATTLSVGGAATSLLLGATTGTATIRNATVNLLGSALTAPATFALANTTSTTLGVGGAATSLLIGATTGTATIRNATVTLAGSALTGPATFSVANTTSTTLGIGGAATSLLIGATTGTATIRNANVVVTGSLSARYTTKSISAASASSVTPDISAYNQYSYTALAAGLTINAPTGSPTDGERLMFRIKDDGNSQTITWDAIYRIIGTVLPTNTVANKTMYIGCIYNTADTKWDVIAVSREA